MQLNTIYALLQLKLEQAPRECKPVAFSIKAEAKAVHSEAKNNA